MTPEQEKTAQTMITPEELQKTLTMMTPEQEQKAQELGSAFCEALAMGAAFSEAVAILKTVARIIEELPQNDVQNAIMIIRRAIQILLIEAREKSRQ